MLVYAKTIAYQCDKASENHLICTEYNYVTGLKSGWVIWVKQVLPGFCIESCALIVAFSIDQNSELSMLDDDDGSVSPDSYSSRD